MTDREQKEIRTAFRQAVNLAPKELERWLGHGGEQVGGLDREEDDESVGHKSGGASSSSGARRQPSCRRTITRI